ncbi:MAG TPA: ribosome recycling factor [Oceanicaulis sp.]|jgi:ribosome recycling factor|uniref:Ribosome-recycling factor n=1 Tax=Glycocaulis albus TaxID=1382801 RepID=A0ABQ1XHN2_9PROT|nr:ribosome recycling factor [Glycocaulis albus]MBV5258687.1 ribosome recycling factor [Synechococcus moorigangaii CMS01]GGG93781.1 ribosome-recycling factor [Glycocaulis albus]HCY56737.1 ribosome recycling factor [Oceanicaulis sp.]
MSKAGDFSLKDIERRMDGAVEALKKEFAGLRTGRASIALLDPIKIDAYGSPTPINQVGTVSVPEPRMLSVQVWDKNLAPAVDKAIRNSSLGLNPVVEGTLIRIPIPPLNEERRAELAKTAGTYAEQARVAVRNVRRDGMEALKRAEKDNLISEDEHKRFSDQVQKATDHNIASIDELLKSKQDEITQV